VSKKEQWFDFEGDTNLDKVIACMRYEYKWLEAEKLENPADYESLHYETWQKAISWTLGMLEEVE
jgi:hypothetical protein